MGKESKDFELSRRIKALSLISFLVACGDEITLAYARKFNCFEPSDNALVFVSNDQMDHDNMPADQKGNRQAEISLLASIFAYLSQMINDDQYRARMAANLRDIFGRVYNKPDLIVIIINRS